MTASDPTEQLAQRNRLAAALRKLRMAADLSTHELATRMGLSQSKVSRLENAKKVPSRSELEAWVEAAGATAQDLAELLELADRALTELTTWREVVHGGHVRNQQAVADLETTAATIHTFHPVIIPGLLQTAEYARQVFLSGDFPTRPGPTDVAAVVAARVERQAILYDQGKRFEFVTTEAALRQRFGPVEATLAQLDRITSIATLPNISVGIIPLNAEVTTWRYHGFVIYDDRSDDQDPLVVVTTLSGSIEVTDPDYVAAYREAFSRLEQAAVFESAARALIAQIGTELR